MSIQGTHILRFRAHGLPELPAKYFIQQKAVSTFNVKFGK
jgi:hypothetical protein